MKTGIITTDTYLSHNTGEGHPERADRVSIIINNLKKFTKKYGSSYLRSKEQLVRS